MTEIDELLLLFIGKDSPTIKGLNIEESNIAVQNTSLNASQPSTSNYDLMEICANDQSTCSLKTLMAESTSLIPSFRFGVEDKLQGKIISDTCKTQKRKKSVHEDTRQTLLH